jgi:hypothetical protein
VICDETTVSSYIPGKRSVSRRKKHAAALPTNDGTTFLIRDGRGIMSK